MRTNQLKRKLAAGQVVVGSFVYVPSSKLTEIVGLSGFDFVVIDMEHGPVDTSVAEDMVRAAEGAGTTPLIRVAHNAPHLILRALDIGAQGLHVPDIDTSQQARQAVSSSKYGPVGTRGLAGVRAADYSMKESMADYAAAANEETMMIAHIESETSVNNLDDLLAVDGINIYYVGPADMSNSLGIPGQANDPRVVKLVEDAIVRIVEAGRVAGCIAGSADAAKRYVDLGALYIASHAMKFMTDTSRAFMQEVRG